jgi:hypothetical protein
MSGVMSANLKAAVVCTLISHRLGPFCSAVVPTVLAGVTIVLAGIFYVIAGIR